MQIILRSRPAWSRQVLRLIPERGYERKVSKGKMQLPLCAKHRRAQVRNGINGVARRGPVYGAPREL